MRECPQCPNTLTLPLVLAPTLAPTLNLTLTLPLPLTPNPAPNPGVVDVSQDGECSSKDSATQWLDCGIPCPIGEESRMSKEDLAP